MTHRTVRLSTYDDYLTSEYSGTSSDVMNARQADLAERRIRLTGFPHAVVLQVAYPELDYANRWCWQTFGPADGECQEASYEYPSCTLRTRHFHDEKWRTHWLAKTDYNFGFNEWCFADPDDRDHFLTFVPQISWGESYPK